MPYSTAALLLVFAFATLAGCGQMGPLYMPTQDTTATAPAADADETQPQPEER